MNLKLSFLLTFVVVLCVNAKHNNINRRSYRLQKRGGGGGGGGVGKGGNACLNTFSVRSARSGQNVLKATKSDIGAQMKDVKVANALKSCNEGFIKTAQQVVTQAKARAVVNKSAKGQVAIAAESLSAQTKDVDASLLTISNPKSSPAQVKAAAVQALADELAEGPERATLAAASKDKTGAQLLLAEVDQLGPPIALHGFSQIAQGLGNTQALARAIVNAREQVIVPANCKLMQQATGKDLCAGRKAMSPSLFK